nr:hypothetical protein [Nitrosomonas sp. Nm84]
MDSSQLDRNDRAPYFGQCGICLGNCHEDVATSFYECLISQGFTLLDITSDHALRAGSLPGPHRDPFDHYVDCTSTGFEHTAHQ